MNRILPHEPASITTNDLRELLDISRDTIPADVETALETLLSALIALDSMDTIRPDDPNTVIVLRDLARVACFLEQTGGLFATATYDTDGLSVAIDPVDGATPSTATTRANVQQAIAVVTEALLEEDQTPPVAAAADINDGYQRYLAEAVYVLLGQPADVDIVELSIGMGDRHTWLTWQGEHFDAEAPDGVETIAELPIFESNRLVLPDDPEPSVITGEFTTVDPAGGVNL